MYVTNILKAKKGKNRKREDRVYCYPAEMSSAVGVIRDEAYIRIIRKLTAEQACKLLIFRYYNFVHAFPPDEIVSLLNESHTVNYKVDVDRTNKTDIKINDHYKLQNVHWTKQQRKACANTRNFFLNQGRGVPEFPQLSDIPFFGNDSFFQEVLIAFLKAKVNPDIMCKICESCFSTLDKILDQPQEMEKQCFNFQPQRKSITVITDEMRYKNKAASTIQRAFRQHLQTKIRAVRIIERYWEPIRLDIIETRLEIRQEQEAHIRVLQEQVNNEDLFKYDELVQEIKDDYNTVRRPEPRLPSYWIKVIAILAFSIFLSTFIKTMPEFGLLIVAYVLGQTMTYYRKVWYITWIQTLALWTWTVFMLNKAFVLNNGWVRIPVWIAIVAFGRQRWMAVFFATMVIRIALTFVYDIFAIQPIEYGIFVYDVYCVATIAAASRQGKPIEMLQKVMINIVMLVIIASGGAVAWVVACLHLGD
tara:strand:+ start:5279 stop:6703 length:1425 start_codon:yes stop_codon:yes gene_type:complete